MTTPPNIISLLRVSGDKQDVMRQKDDMESLQQRFGVTFARTVELHGVSGTETLNDVQVQRILAELADPAIDGIGISSLDRLLRPAKDYGQWRILQPFVVEGKRIWSAREGLINPADDEGYDKCMSAGTRAGAEWRETKRRSMGGKLKLAKMGFIPHGRPKFGWDVEGRKQTGRAREGRWVINEAEAAIARKLFEWRNDGIQTYTLASKLNQMGVRNKYGEGGVAPPKEWSRKTVLQLLNNTDYIGQHRWSGIIIPVPRIVDDELFYSVQAKMANSKKQWIGAPSKHYLLRSFLWCALCKHRCVGTRSGKHTCRNRNYRCGYETNKPPRRRMCTAKQILRETLEEAAWDAIWGMLKDPERLYRMGREILESETRPHLEALAQMERELEQLHQRDRNLSRLMKEARTDQEFEDLRKERLEVRERRRELEAAVHQSNKVVDLPAPNILEAYVRRITEGSNPTTYDERRVILEGLPELRMEYADSELTITGKVPVAQAGAMIHKWERGIGNAPNSGLRIPFNLKVRVA